MPQYYSHFASKQPIQMTWQQVLDEVRSTCNTLYHTTLRSRQLRSEGHEKEANDLKRKSGCILPAGCCQGGRDAKNLVALTLFGMVDIDHIPTDQMAEVLRRVKADAHTYFCAVTNSQQGIRIIFRYQVVNEADGELWPEARFQKQPDEEQSAYLARVTPYYRAAWEAGTRYFAELTGHPSDKSCKDIVRLSFLCHDPDALLNRDAEPLTLTEADVAPYRQNPRRPSPTDSAHAAPVRVREVIEEKALEAFEFRIDEGIIVRLLDKHGYAPSSRHTFWLKLGARLRYYGHSLYEVDAYKTAALRLLNERQLVLSDDPSLRLPHEVEDAMIYGHNHGQEADEQWIEEHMKRWQQSAQTPNSSLLTPNSSFLTPNSSLLTPDYRKWGGGTHTAQNQRLVYWGMLKSGDTDLMKPQLDYYLRLLQTAELRSRVYWSHEGACYTEQMENFGLPNPAEYGKHPDKKGNGQDPGVENNRWLEYEWDTALEFCQMALEAHRYAGMDITAYEPMILSCLRFFDQHYTERDSIGRKIIFPGSGCETYKIARNPASTVAALTAVASSYMAYKQSDELAETLANLPVLPTYEQQGKLCLAPAESWERINNVETPQLYPVWPWRLTGLWDTIPHSSLLIPNSSFLTPHSPLLPLALNTYQCDSIALKNRTHIGWKQDNIWAACLGLTDDAYQLTMQKLADGPFRFPAFWGPGYDWMPDHNWGGSAVIGLEEMLLQENPITGELYILPAWPKDKDIHFKLYATGGRIVEVTQKDGKITQKVTKKFGDTK